MSDAVFERGIAFIELGLDHGFGTIGAASPTVPRLAMARQVHGDRALEVHAPQAAGPASSSEADALFTGAPGLAVGVWTADCVPILLAHRGRRGVAAIHAGWRGSALGIARSAVAAAAEGLGARPQDFLALIGPHIGACCYEVDAPVFEAIRDPEVFSAGRRSDRYQLDLFALNRKQLLAAGIRADRIGRVGGCTFCSGGRYASFRRDGGGGRMLHYVRMPGTGPAPHAT